MAILKQVETPHGVVAQYHKLIKAEFSAADAAVTLMVAIYANAEARNAGLHPMWHEYIRIPFASFENDPREVLYSLVTKFGDSYLKDGYADTSVNAEAGIELTTAAQQPT